MIDSLSNTALSGNPSLTVDSLGRVHILVPTSDSLIWRVGNYKNWTYTLTAGKPANGMGNGCKVEVDSLNLPHIAYGLNTVAGLAVVYSYLDTTGGGANWPAETLDLLSSSFLSNLVVFPFVLDSSDNPHLVYPDTSNTYLMHVYKSGGNWQYDTLPNPPFTGNFKSVSLAIDRYQQLHIAYDVTTGGGQWEVYYAIKDTTGNWVNHSQVSTLGKKPYVTVTRTGLPRITYLHGRGSPTQYNQLTYTYPFPTPEIDTDKDTLYFVVTDTTAPDTQVLWVKNIGDTTLVVDTISATGWLSLGISEITPASFDLAIGDSQEVIIIADGGTLSNGNYTGTIIISSNDPVTPALMVQAYLDVQVGVGEGSKEKISIKTQVFPISPNPINKNNITFRFSVPTSTRSTIYIYDITGRIVHKIENISTRQGMNTIRWDTRDNSGRLLPAGVYFYRLNLMGKEFIRNFSIVR